MVSKAGTSVSAFPKVRGFGRAGPIKCLGGTMMPQQGYFERLNHPQKHVAGLAGLVGPAKIPLISKARDAWAQLPSFERAFSDPWQGSCHRFVPDQ